MSPLKLSGESSGKMSGKSQNLTVVGAGISGLWQAYWLRYFFPNRKIHLVENKSLFRPVSYYSHPVVALRNTQSEMSQLGELIGEAYEFFKSDLVQLVLGQIPGSRLLQYGHIYDSSDQRMTRRYGESPADQSFKKFLKLSSSTNSSDPLQCFWEEGTLFNPPVFLDHFRSFLNNEYQISSLDRLYSTEQLLESSESVKIVCCGSWSKLFNDKVKLKSGAFGKTSFTSASFLFDYKGMTVSCSDGELCISAENRSGNVGYYGLNELENRYLEFCSHWIGDRLPAFNGFSFQVGTRDRIRKMNPVWGEFKSNVYCLYGLYKNGWLLAPYLAYQNAQLIREKIEA